MRERAALSDMCEAGVRAAVRTAVGASCPGIVGDLFSAPRLVDSTCSAGYRASWRMVILHEAASCCKDVYSQALFRKTFASANQGPALTEDASRSRTPAPVAAPNRVLWSSLALTCWRVADEVEIAVRIQSVRHCNLG